MDNVLMPESWTPSGPRRTVAHPTVGDLVGWRYAVWQVTDVHVRDLVSLPPATQEAIAARPATHHARLRPGSVSLEHVLGPTAVPPADDHVQVRHVGGQLLADVAFNPLEHPGWHVLDARFEVCSCHAHPWPCVEAVRDRAAARAAERLERALDGSQPGVCASCIEPVSGRQRFVEFPEPSLIVPGAPGPWFHVSRGGCFIAARRYEIDLRLPAYPTATRLASCPGVLFTHETQAEECTAGPACTELHGPASRAFGRGHPCTRRTYLSAAELLRPPSDCGYRGDRGACLGGPPGQES
jgi:hypothetical protein